MCMRSRRERDDESKMKLEMCINYYRSCLHGVSLKTSIKHVTYETIYQIYAVYIYAGKLPLFVPIFLFYLIYQCLLKRHVIILQ